MKRVYDQLIEYHFEQQKYRQMIFLAGPRQVGKTTISFSAKRLAKNFYYLNWDNQQHRDLILRGPLAIAEAVQLHTLQAKKTIIVFDEIHKYKNWKTFLKGFFDTYQDKTQIIVTGSAKLDIYIPGEDSLMGRYFPYRVHPISVSECVHPKINADQLIQANKKLAPEQFFALLKFGGFPEPFLKQDIRFSRRWQNLRQEQLFRNDIREISQIQEISRLEILAKTLQQQSGQLLNYSNLANKIQVSVDTIKRWIDTLNTFYYCFTIQPWSKNLARGLLKQPKVYLWNWAEIDDAGQRAENFIASHLLKATHFWTDLGLGEFDLYFIRDKDKREVDFLVTQNNEPWFLVEVKQFNQQSVSKHLYLFHQLLKTKFAFQVVIDMDYINANCFDERHNEPLIVPAITFLSQLI